MIKLSVFVRFTTELLSKTLFRRVLVVKLVNRGRRGFTDRVCERFQRRNTENRERTVSNVMTRGVEALPYY